MSIKSDLKKDGIEVIEKLDTLKINSCYTKENYK